MKTTCASLSSSLLVLLLALFLPSVKAFPTHPNAAAATTALTSTTRLHDMKRPFLDSLATTLFRLETARVDASSEVDDKGREGEPMARSEADSLANRWSEVMASNDLLYQFKQWVADIVAGSDYDVASVEATVEEFIHQSTTKRTTTPVVLFSFSTCPFCRRAKDTLEDLNIPYASLELDELPGNEGNEIRAVLGRQTKRTSVPAIFVRGTFIGGCNDGAPGLMPLVESGKLQEMIQ